MRPHVTKRRLHGGAAALLLVAVSAAATLGRPGDDHRVVVIDDGLIRQVEDTPLVQEPDGFNVRFAGQVLEKSLELPRPDGPADAHRITARLRVRPVERDDGGVQRPNDPWNRLGSVSVVLPPRDGGGWATEVEMMRFVTGYGGRCTFTQDVTAFAPLLAGERTVRLFLSSYTDPPGLPGWVVSLDLLYTEAGRGFRRPAWVQPLFNDPHLEADGRGRGRLVANVTVPPGLALPRVRILTTGHSTDGIGEHEFVTATHVLRVDGREITRWRPWAEGDGRLRDLNPQSGRRMVDGRWIWSSDLDRSGWRPGEVVEPLFVPVPELTPGRHQVELEVLGIRPAAGEDRHHGYWVVSAAIVADEPWSATAPDPIPDD